MFHDNYDFLQNFHFYTKTFVYFSEKINFFEKNIFQIFLLKYSRKFT